MTSFGFIGPMSAMLALDILVVVGSEPRPDAATQPTLGTTPSQGMAIRRVGVPSCRKEK